VILKSLQLQAANQEREAAEAQKDRSQVSFDYFGGLIDDGLSAGEKDALDQLRLALWLPASVAVSVGFMGPAATGGVSIAYSPSGILQTYANILATQAGYARREEDWKYQQRLANEDIRMAGIGMDIADTHVSIADQERSLADTRAEFARDNVAFLTSRFTNAELYRWMSKNLRRLYREQLNLALATAKAAQRALEFERQRSIDVIGFDYWDDSRKGLLGAERLTQDLDKLEQYRLSTDQRRREIELTLSLAAVAPVELQRFRETGLMNFSTATSWLDRQFPGHYLRLIKNVSVSVFALVPPGEGIKATLSNSGVSRVMSGPPFAEEAIIYRLPEAVSLSSPTNATGLFELRPDDPKLFPFEGSGVATLWRLEMPKGSNRFDFSTIADVILKVRYTALEDATYRQQVLAAMGQDEAGYVPTEMRRAFSVRQSFPDEWYALKNSAPGSAIVPRFIAADYLPNESERRIRAVTVLVSWSAGRAPTVPLLLDLEFTPDGSSAARSTLSVPVDPGFVSTQDFNGRSPYGQLSLKPVTAQASLIDAIEDILIVIDYRAKAHYAK
jgi:hypothetical protein